MAAGILVGICITPEGGAAMQPVEQVEAIAGKGLVGDRYASCNGSFQTADVVAPAEELTLIEEEALQGASAEYDLVVAHADTRRNLLTRGVALNHLVGCEFRIGEVLLAGIELCEPCSHLEKLTCEGIRESLVHRGGLRARIIEGGTLSLDDPVTSVTG
jgi:MOSC domain-containing protein YiiM